MLLYTEALCQTASLARTLVPLAHLLGGLGLALLGPRAWIVVLGGLVLPLALALQYSGSDDALGAVALSAWYWVGAAAGWALRPRVHTTLCAAPGGCPAPGGTAPRVTWWYAQRRVAALAALALLAGWRIDDVLCVSGVPVGLARSFMLWLGAALIDAYVWCCDDVGGVGGSAQWRAAQRYVAAGATAYACFSLKATLLAPLARVAATGALLLAGAALLRWLR